MTHRKLVVAGTVVALAFGGGSAAMAASAAKAPKATTVKEKQPTTYTINRGVQNGLRWDKDVYHVRSGGTIHFVANKLGDGPHTFSVVKKKDLPKNDKQIEGCQHFKGICGQLAAAHGATPQSEVPQFQFVENGKGTNTPPKLDRAGDSAALGFGPDQTSVDLKVTAKKGSTLHFFCLVHPWMQAKVEVG